MSYIKYILPLLALPSIAFEVKAEEKISLKQIFSYALNQDPTVLEAKANQVAAQNQTEQAVSEHYPRVSVFGQKPLQNYNRYNSDTSKKFIPGASVTMNIYSFGAIEKKVKSSELNAQAFKYKYDEVRENLSFTIGDLYISILKGKADIAAQKQALSRLKAIMADLDAIADYDEGRRSEFVRAESRVYGLEQQITSTEREVENKLNQLRRYIGKKSDISFSNPFSTFTVGVLKEHYTQKQVEHPSYQVAKAKIDSADATMKAEKAARYPKLNLQGNITRDERQIYMNVSWDIFNRATGYSVQEKAQQIEAEQQRLEQTVLDLEERKATALTNLEQYRVQREILEKQSQSLAQTAKFYQLQFSIGKRSLLDLLDVENELLNAELNKSSAEYQFGRAILDYLYSQGMTTNWALGLK